MNRSRWSIGRLGLCLLATAAILQAVPTQAAQTQDARTLTLGQAVELARSNSSNLQELDRTLANLEDQHQDMVELSESMATRLNGLKEFEELYTKMSKYGLDEVEAIKYRYYQMNYGFQPPDWDDEFLFNTFVRNRDFPHKQLQVALENTERSKELLKSSVSMQVRMMYDQWLTLGEMLELQRSVYDDTLKQKQETEIKRKQGAATEWDVYSLETDLAVAELNIKKLERNTASLEINLKSMAGLSLTSKIKPDDYELPELKTTVTDLATYEKLADSQRTDVLNARNEYDNKVREWEILSSYITDPEEFDRIQAQQAMKQEEYELKLAKLTVKEEVHRAYDQVSAKRQELKAAEKQLTIAEKQLQQTKRSLERGTVAPSMVSKAQIQLMQAENGLQQKKREYALAVYRLELTCTTGPGVSATEGGSRSGS